MIKISDVVSDLIKGDEVALEAFRAGLLNLSAYARKIQPLVEQRSMKPVRTGSIVTALSRTYPASAKFPMLKPLVKIEDMSIKSPLAEITLEKTAGNIVLIDKVKNNLGTGFLTVTQGVGEVTIIFSQESLEKVENQLAQNPKGKYSDLVAITVRFIEQDYIEVPNMIYSLVAALASRRINLIEIVSTFTEITFVVRQKDSSETVDVLRERFFK